MEVIGRYTD